MSMHTYKMYNGRIDSLKFPLCESYIIYYSWFEEQWKTSVGANIAGVHEEAQWTSKLNLNALNQLITV